MSCCSWYRCSVGIAFDRQWQSGQLSRVRLGLDDIVGVCERDKMFVQDLLFAESLITRATVVFLQFDVASHPRCFVLVLERFAFARNGVKMGLGLVVVCKLTRRRTVKLAGHTCELLGRSGPGPALLK
jgi:hypothetical protein